MLNSKELYGLVVDFPGLWPAFPCRQGNAGVFPPTWIHVDATLHGWVARRGRHLHPFLWIGIVAFQREVLPAMLP